jgi:SCP1.201-like deaminase
LITTPGGNILPSYSGGKTSGILVDPSGEETPIRSGIDGPSRGVTGVPGMHNRIKTHVEAHAAILMRRRGLVAATLYINRVPCPTNDPRSPGCFDNLPKMLPQEAKLRVIGPEGFDLVFVGLPDLPGTTIFGF